MKAGAPQSFGAQLKALRDAAGFTQEELATISGLSVHAVSALERGERRRPHVETVRALSAALDLTGAGRDALLASARARAHNVAGGPLRAVRARSRGGGTSRPPRWRGGRGAAPGAPPRVGAAPRPPRRWGAIPRGAAIRGTRAGRAASFSSHRRKPSHPHEDLQA